MTHSPSSRRRRRSATLAVVVLALATVASALTASPAAAANAPLVTTDGIGIRIDENALLGPALEAIEDELQPWVNDRIYQGALENSVMDDPDWVQGSANLELSLDFVNAGTSGYPQGGLKVHADLQNIVMRFYRYGEWWQPECQFRVNPADATIDASARIDTSKLPNAPLTMNPVAATWDDDPDITREKGNFLCTGYLLDEWWDGLWGNGTDVAADLEAELDAIAQDMIDDVWDEHVRPVLDSLGDSFGITPNQIRTDDHGLIVTANVNATGGVSIPGFGGPFDVTDAVDAGVTSNVNTLLAQRSEVTVSLHPNVANQYAEAVRQMFGGNFGQPAIDGPYAESILLQPADRAAYDDNGWYASLDAPNPGPHFAPTGSGGAPQMAFPNVEISIYNTSVSGPVATFSGSIGAVGLITEVRSGSSNWGPALDSSSLSLSVTRTQANVDAAKVAPQTSSAIRPIAQHQINDFSDGLFVFLLTLAPIEIGPVSVDLCTTCGRFSGDQRYTERFNVN